MHLFDYLATNQCKLNDLDVDWPYDSNNVFDVTKGPSAFPGMLGEYWDYDTKAAQKFSNTNNGTLSGGRYQLVRTHPTSVAALLVGRPLFWQDRAKFVVTPDAAATSLFAGVALNVPVTKGSMVIIQTLGEVDGLYKGVLTKGAPAIDDLVVLDISGGVATFDVLADATTVTWLALQSLVGRVSAAVTAGQKSKLHLMDLGFRTYTRGIAG